MEAERALMDKRNEQYQQLLKLSEAVNAEEILRLLQIVDEVREETKINQFDTYESEDQNSQTITVAKQLKDLQRHKSQFKNHFSQRPINQTNKESLDSSPKKQGHVITKAKTPLAFSSRVSRNLVKPIIMSFVVPSPLRDSIPAEDKHSILKTKRKSMDYCSNNSALQQQSKKQYQAYLTQHQLKQDNNQMSNKSQKSISPSTPNQTAGMFQTQRISIGGGIKPYQKNNNQLVDVQSFVSMYSESSYKTSPNFKRLQLEQVNQQLQSGGGRSDSQKTTKAKDTTLRKSIIVSKTTSKKNLLKLDSNKIGLEVLKEQQILTQRERSSRQSFASTPMNQTPCQKHFQSVILRSSISPRSKQQDSKSLKSARSKLAEKQNQQEKLPLGQQIFYDKKFFNIPPPIFSARYALQLIKSKKKNQGKANMGSVQNQSKKPLPSMMSSFGGTSNTRNNVLSAGSYSMGSDELNQRQSVNDDNYHGNHQTENIQSTEIVIEDNEYEDVQLKNLSEESLIADTPSNEGYSENQDQEIEDVKLEVIEQFDVQEVMQISQELNLIDEVKENSSQSSKQSEEFAIPKIEIDLFSSERPSETEMGNQIPAQQLEQFENENHILETQIDNRNESLEDENLLISEETQVHQESMQSSDKGDTHKIDEEIIDTSDPIDIPDYPIEMIDLPEEVKEIELNIQENYEKVGSQNKAIDVDCQISQLIQPIDIQENEENMIETSDCIDLPDTPIEIIELLEILDEVRMNILKNLDLEVQQNQPNVINEQNVQIIEPLDINKQTENEQSFKVDVIDIPDNHLEIKNFDFKIPLQLQQDEVQPIQQEDSTNQVFTEQLKTDYNENQIDEVIQDTEQINAICEQLVALTFQDLMKELNNIEVTKQEISYENENLEQNLGESQQNFDGSLVKSQSQKDIDSNENQIQSQRSPALSQQSPKQLDSFKSNDNDDFNFMEPQQDLLNKFDSQITEVKNPQIQEIDQDVNNSQLLINDQIQVHLLQDQQSMANEEKVCEESQNLLIISHDQRIILESDLNQPMEDQQLDFNNLFNPEPQITIKDECEDEFEILNKQIVEEEQYVQTDFDQADQADECNESINFIEIPILPETQDKEIQVELNLTELLIQDYIEIVVENTELNLVSLDDAQINKIQNRDIVEHLLLDLIQQALDQIADNDFQIYSEQNLRIEQVQMTQALFQEIDFQMQIENDEEFEQNEQEVQSIDFCRQEKDEIEIVNQQINLDDHENKSCLKYVGSQINRITENTISNCEIKPQENLIEISTKEKLESNLNIIDENFIQEEISYQEISIVQQNESMQKINNGLENAIDLIGSDYYQQICSLVDDLVLIALRRAISLKQVQVISIDKQEIILEEMSSPLIIQEVVEEDKKRITAHKNDHLEFSNEIFDQNNSIQENLDSKDFQMTNNSIQVNFLSQSINSLQQDELPQIEEVDNVSIKFEQDDDNQKPITAIQQILDNNYFQMLLPPIIQVPLCKETSGQHSFEDESQHEEVLQIVRTGRAGVAKKGLKVQQDNLNQESSIQQDSISQDKTFTVEFIEKRPDHPVKEQAPQDTGLLTDMMQQPLDNESYKNSESEDEGDFVFLTDQVPGADTILGIQDSSSNQSSDHHSLSHHSEEEEAQVVQHVMQLETLREEDSNDDESQSPSEEEVQPEIAEQMQPEDESIPYEQSSQSSQLEEPPALIQEEVKEEVIQQADMNDENDLDLTKMFLGGSYNSNLQQDFQKYVPPEQVPLDNLSNQSERVNSQNLSDLDSDHGDLGVGRDQMEAPREILQPTLENMRRMELKNRRKDVEGSIFNSSILEYLKPQVHSQINMQEESKEPADQAQQEQHQNKDISMRLSFPTALQPQLPRFSQLGKGSGARSTYYEPIQQKQPLVTKSQYSAQSTGSAKIGMLMKGLDGGSMFMRQALKKQQQQSPNLSQMSGSQDGAYYTKANPIHLGSDGGHSEADKQSTNSNTKRASMFMSNPFGLYAAAGFQIPNGMLAPDSQEQ